jgi:membrane carboxypeptidase/penicillin-binding protein PbpC
MVHGMDGGDTERLGWFMWKTGTSSGRRDAWAVGHNLRYAAGVWVGRFRGTGRLDYVGAEAAEPLLARIFCLPMIRNESEPDDPRPIVVKRPLPKPLNPAERLAIMLPENGQTYIAMNGTVRLPLKASCREPLNWFMNDRLMDAGTESVELQRGTYQLVCVGSNGQSAKAMFTVR